MKQVCDSALAAHCRWRKSWRAAVQKVLNLSTRISIDDDFFHGLGGDSLLAAELISNLRDDPATASLTVRSVYEARTVAELAKRVEATGEITPIIETQAERRQGRPVLATLIQTLWLVLVLMVGAPVAYLLAFQALPYLSESLGLIPFLLLAAPLYCRGHRRSIRC